MESSAKSIGELMCEMFARYVTVHPEGLELRSGDIVASASARLLGSHPARTYYVDRKPNCRSLDGVRPLKGDQTCAACVFRKKCTPQLCVDLLLNGIPERLLLAFTSLRNFLLFVEERRHKGAQVEGAQILLVVRNRGKWGEVCFLADTSKNG
ncbi:MAG: hypothetical protein HYZ53_27495 [Planctomycetes bacterium]|nr:hypothetical protein [Planctomycetota bacterium]